MKQERQARRWTLDRLAEAAGVSRRMVVPALVDPSESRPVKVTRRGEGAALWTGEFGGRGVLVAGTGPPDVLDLWDWTLAPGDLHSNPGKQPARLSLTVFEPAVGSSVSRLEAADA